MKKIIFVLLCTILISSCALYENNPEAIKKAYSYQAVPDKSVIYIIRDFPVTKPTILRFAMIEEHDPDSRNKLEDAMNTLDGDSIEGAGIPFDHFFLQKNSFARLEMPPAKYEMYAFFAYAGSASEVVQSRKRKNLKPGQVYFFKIAPRDDGPYSSTIYYLEEIEKDEANQIIKNKKLPLLEFNPIY